MREYVESGGEKYLKWARNQLKRLKAMRESLKLPSLSKSFVPEAGYRVDLRTSETGDRLRVYAGGGYGFIASFEVTPPAGTVFPTVFSFGDLYATKDVTQWKAGVTPERNNSDPPIQYDYGETRLWHYYYRGGYIKRLRLIPVPYNESVFEYSAPDFARIYTVNGVEQIEHVHVRTPEETGVPALYRATGGTTGAAIFTPYPNSETYPPALLASTTGAVAAKDGSKILFPPTTDLGTAPYSLHEAMFVGDPASPSVEWRETALDRFGESRMVFNEQVTTGAGFVDVIDEWTAEETSTVIPVSYGYDSAGTRISIDMVCSRQFELSLDGGISSVGSGVPFTTTYGGTWTTDSSETVYVRFPGCEPVLVYTAPNRKIWTNESTDTYTGSTYVHNSHSGSMDLYQRSDVSCEILFADASVGIVVLALYEDRYTATDMYGQTGNYIETSGYIDETGTRQKSLKVFRKNADSTVTIETVFQTALEDLGTTAVSYGVGYNSFAGRPPTSSYSESYYDVTDASEYIGFTYFPRTEDLQRASRLGTTLFGVDMSLVGLFSPWDFTDDAQKNLLYQSNATQQALRATIGNAYIIARRKEAQIELEDGYITPEQYASLDAELTALSNSQDFSGYVMKFVDRIEPV
jgi:hypothetical protein